MFIKFELVISKNCIMQPAIQQNNSRKILAIVLIVFGFVLILKESGMFYHFPYIHLNEAFTPAREIFHNLGYVIFSWPAILIFVGLILMAGKRSAGVVLLIIGGVFLLPKLFFLSGAFLLLLLPMVLIAIGIAIVARII